MGCEFCEKQFVIRINDFWKVSLIEAPFGSQLESKYNDGKGNRGGAVITVKYCPFCGKNLKEVSE